MMMLLYTGASSFAFSMFKWFFSGKGTNCGGWGGFPTFGLQALKWTWQFDWSLTYMGVGGLLDNYWFSSSYFFACLSSIPVNRLSPRQSCSRRALPNA